MWFLWCGSALATGFHGGSEGAQQDAVTLEQIFFHFLLVDPPASTARTEDTAIEDRNDIVTTVQDWL